MLEVLQLLEVNRMNDGFSRYHPLVNFAYFAFIFGYSMVFMHPICLSISLIGGFLYSVELKGSRALKFNLMYLLPTMVFTALINPVFNHEGATILMYLHTGNPLTLESILYGLAAASMLVAVIMWFTAYNEIMTSDKFVYLFGRIIPSLSLVLSMSLRFVPRFKAQIKVVSDAQRCIGRDVSNGSILERARHGMTILSIMITWALENAIETADSMKSRGYGLEGRSSFSIYKFEKRDILVLTVIFVLGIYILVGSVLGGFRWRYFPSIRGKLFNFYSISLWLAYGALALTPIFVNRWEDRQWEATQLKI